jgi:hypothetical protein
MAAAPTRWHSSMRPAPRCAASSRAASQPAQEVLRTRFKRPPSSRHPTRTHETRHSNKNTHESRKAVRARWEMHLAACARWPSCTSIGARIENPGVDQAFLLRTPWSPASALPRVVFAGRATSCTALFGSAALRGSSDSCLNAAVRFLPERAVQVEGSAAKPRRGPHSRARTPKKNNVKAAPTNLLCRLPEGRRN